MWKNEAAVPVLVPLRARARELPMPQDEEGSTHFHLARGPALRRILDLQSIKAFIESEVFSADQAEDGTAISGKDFLLAIREVSDKNLRVFFQEGFSIDQLKNELPHIGGFGRWQIIKTLDKLVEFGALLLDNSGTNGAACYKFLIIPELENILNQFSFPLSENALGLAGQNLSEAIRCVDACCTLPFKDITVREYLNLRAKGARIPFLLEGDELMHAPVSVTGSHVRLLETLESGAARLGLIKLIEGSPPKMILNDNIKTE